MLEEKLRQYEEECRMQNAELKIQNRKSFIRHSSFVNSERGVALLMVLWVMVFLTVIVSEFAHSMRVEVNITRNFKEEAEALSLSEAGLNLAFAEILRDLDYVGTDKDGEAVFIKKGSESNKENIEDKPVRKGIKLGSGSINYSITDEDSKININNASRDTIVKLLELSGVEAGEMRDAIADSIEDWRDEDSLHRLNGAEEDYYMSLPSPYHCKNGNFDTVEELLMVKGMTTEILYGNMEIASPSARKDNEEPENGKYAGIYQYLTVFGSGTINLNTAPELLLRVVKGDEEAKNIILKRQENKGVYDENQKSYMFAIESTGIISGVRGQGSGVRGEEIETQNTESGFNKRTTKVICRKDGSGKDAKITIRYWNDNYIPYKKIG